MHNLVMKDFGRDYQFCADSRQVNFYPSKNMRYFQGFARPGGRVGTRNYLAVISSVNCSASVSNYVRDRFRNPEFQRAFLNVDGVIAFTHKAGCAMDPGEPQQVLQRVLAGIARHPNISGYVMIGLGCESNQVEAIRQAYRLDERRPGETAPKFMTIQTAGGVRKTVEAAVTAVTQPLTNSSWPRTAVAPMETAASPQIQLWALPRMSWCGTILEGKETVEQVGQRIFEKIVAVASGEKTKSELAGIGDEEFAPWQLGPTF